MRPAFAAIAALVIATPAMAAESPSAEILRQWPRAGTWSTAMIRTSSQDLACYTAAAPISSASRTLPGLRIKGDDLAIEITDHDARALGGNAIQVVVDGAPVGRFDVTERLHGFGVTTILAEVPLDRREQVMSAFQHGRSILFLTGAARYTASLAGTNAASASLLACMDGARDLAEAPR